MFNSVMISGHRKQEFSREEETYVKKTLYKIVKELVKNYETTCGLTGLATGVDTWFAQILLKNNIPYIGYIPFPQQPTKWPEPEQQQYQNILKNAQKTKTFGNNYSNKYFFIRNDAMIEDSDLAIIVCKNSKTSGGTYHVKKSCLKYNKPAIIIEPDTQKVLRKNF